MREQQVGAVDRGGDVVVALPQVRDDQLADDHLGPALRVHDAFEQRGVVGLNVGPQRPELEAFLLDQPLVVRARADDRRVAERPQLGRRWRGTGTDPVRPPARQDDTRHADDLAPTRPATSLATSPARARSDVMCAV